MTNIIQSEITESTYISQQNVKLDRLVGKKRRAQVCDSVMQAKGEVTRKGEEAKKPSLPSPTASFNGLNGQDEGNSGETMGLIAIIGEVMALQAKSNSNFWSTLWNQASESMMSEVKFAPVIAKAIDNSYQAQSAATQAQADSAEASGWISIFTFGSGMVMGGMEGNKTAIEEEGQDAIRAAQETNTGTESSASKAEDTDDNGASAAVTTADNDADAIAEDTDEAATGAAQDAEETRENWGDRTKRMKDRVLDKVEEGSRARDAPILSKGLERSYQMQMASQGFNGLFVEKHYKTIEANQQAIQGKQQAVSKEGEMIAQFYGQSFSRLDELARGAQQNLDYAMNILKSSADTITQTITSMFRG